MVTSEERSPSEDCALDSEQFFELNVLPAMSTGNSGSKPIRLECTADPFGAAGISVDMQGRAFRAKNVYAIPGAGDGSPPLEVALDGRGQASDRKGGGKGTGKRVQSSQESPLYVDKVSCRQKRSFQSVPKGSQEVDLLNRRGAP